MIKCKNRSGRVVYISEKEFEYRLGRAEVTEMRQDNVEPEKLVVEDTPQEEEEVVEEETPAEEEEVAEGEAEETTDTLDELRAKYQEQEGKEVPVNKKNDAEWISSKL